MTRTKSPKFALLDARASFSAPYLDEYPDIDLIQPDPVEMEMEPESRDQKIKAAPLPAGHRRKSVTR
jgi:hypothetical protein